MPLPRKFPKSEKGRSKSERILANRYKVEKRLGSGNFGTAWLVTDLKCKDEKEVLKVLKEVPVGDLQPDETVDAMHEAGLLRNLDHPGIIKFYDSFIDGKFFCIITEFAEGGDLDQIIHDYKKKGKSIPEAQVVEWTIQLLLSVQYMHDRKILHRDLKTRNIFLKNNMIKIGDFGISRIMMGTTDLASTFVGTPYYMSPEVLKHEGYNSKSDVWSIGCILYELCHLDHAFEGQSLMGVMYKIVEGNLPAWPKKYSSELKKVFEKILTKDPAARPSASEMLKVPFMAKQMELLKNTMVDKHHAKENKDIINKEYQQIHQVLKQNQKLEDLRKESEEQMLKNMSPRERMRLRKQKEADDKARRMKAAALQQHVDNKMKYNEIRHNQNPYEVGNTLANNRDEQQQHLQEMTDYAFGGTNRPKTAPSKGWQPVVHPEIRTYIIDESEDEDEEDEDEVDEGGLETGDVSEEEEEEMQTVVEKQLTVKPATSKNKSLKPATSTMKSLKPAASKTKPSKGKVNLSRTLDPNQLPTHQQYRQEYQTLAPDERPITPMKDLMVYSMRESSLDFKDGIPDKPDLAETYYSQFEDFEAVGDEGEEVEEEEDMEGTLVDIGAGANQEEVEDLINCMQNALDKSDTIKSQTLLDDSSAGAFGPTARKIKVKNLRLDCEKKLGKDQFDRAYEYLRNARFGEQQQTPTLDESDIMKGLARIVKNPNDCFLVDQLLFLEAQQELT